MVKTGRALQYIQDWGGGEVGLERGYHFPLQFKHVRLNLKGPEKKRGSAKICKKNCQGLNLFLWPKVLVYQLNFQTGDLKMLWRSNFHFLSEDLLVLPAIPAPDQGCPSPCLRLDETEYSAGESRVFHVRVSGSSSSDPDFARSSVSKPVE